jgi:PhoPQ-activated pathogenicity-related protein
MRFHKRFYSLTLPAFCSLLLLLSRPECRGGALEDYVRQPDDSYSWKVAGREDTDKFDIARLDLVSQKWREGVWTHHLLVVHPKVLRNPDIGLLFVTGSGNGDKLLKTLEVLAERARATVAVITDVPNQPLYDGKREDALIAYTFSQYLKTGDATWPLLFPMTKSAVRALDAMQEFGQKEFHQKMERFVVTGASKRGWTTWLTAAVDKRVVGIAPMVIDMLNMKVQAEWQKTVYGRQSEMVNDYTDAGLLNHMDAPPMVKMRGWVDPYSYRAQYKIPKLLLLGTNDPYWTVDSLRNYWNDLPEPKLVFETPNAGHDLNGGGQAVKSLATFFQLIADHQPLPEMKWKIDYDKNEKAKVVVNLDRPARTALLWTATSEERDFRKVKWTSQELKFTKGDQLEATVEKPQSGYRAFLVEADLVDAAGQPYQLSTEARVIPDTQMQPAKPGSVPTN